MNIAIPKETLEGEKRVAQTAETVKKLIDSGFQVFMEKGAGLASAIRDEDYKQAGAGIEDHVAPLYQKADVILKVQAPTPQEFNSLKEKTILIAFLYPLARLDLVEQLARKKITSFSMDMIPRIARAQKLDALSSQSNLTGYKAVLLAANATGKLMPMLMTAAGTIQPARVLVIGAGVAGLQAIATAKRLGARVEAFDTRPIVKEQVESLGGIFVSLPVKEETEDQAGYAKELSSESHKRELALIAEHARNSDIVITTALIPGNPAPKLIVEETVRQMKVGSVIVDLAAEFGGNTTLTEPGKEVEKHGVKIIGYTNLPSLMAEEASRLYARNVMNLIFEIWKEGSSEIDFENEVVRESLITHQGEIVHSRVQELVGARKDSSWKS
ncbi:MAG: Re/Si-specific NAD(P)(+) transhydrogenase subunit alpha [Candidatus Omnitrophica bacterium]|nr:Re/Si-specific NAD(P)(+) transhydrogenase subunit alpha [Candidatus Omnitrophota bacterium]